MLRAQFFEVLDLSDKFVFLCSPFDVNVIDLEGGQQQAHSFVINHQILANNDVKEELHVIVNITPQKFSQQHSVHGIRKIEVNFTD